MLKTFYVVLRVWKKESVTTVAMLLMLRKLSSHGPHGNQIHPNEQPTEICPADTNQSPFSGLFLTFPVDGSSNSECKWDMRNNTFFTE